MVLSCEIEESWCLRSDPASLHPVTTTIGVNVTMNMVTVPESVRMHFHDVIHLFLREPGFVLFQGKRGGVDQRESDEGGQWSQRNQAIANRSKRPFENLSHLFHSRPTERRGVPPEQRRELLQRQANPFPCVPTQSVR